VRQPAAAGEPHPLGDNRDHGDKHDKHLEVRTVSNYEAAPAGEIEVEVVASSVGDVAWKASQDNPRGECLRLRLSAGRDYGFIFTDVPLDWGRMLDAVRHAAGVEGEELLPESFVGRRARVVLKRYQAKDGTTRATVARWLPPAKPEPEKPAVRVTATVLKPAATKVSRNAPPAFGADDDLPF
jgi:hypothetical protein